LSLLHQHHNLKLSQAMEERMEAKNSSRRSVSICSRVSCLGCRRLREGQRLQGALLYRVGARGDDTEAKDYGQDYHEGKSAGWRGIRDMSSMATVDEVNKKKSRSMPVTKQETRPIQYGGRCTTSMSGLNDDGEQKHSLLE